jgi:hypothetical protein
VISSEHYSGFIGVSSGESAESPFRRSVEYTERW